MKSTILNANHNMAKSSVWKIKMSHR